ncbi:hypothetical protein ACGTN9_03250 [Halobacillus sp. MO56]
MDIKNKLYEELLYLEGCKNTAIMISVTAKDDVRFKILPRRGVLNITISCFMINDKSLLKETLSFFDGKVDYVYIDIEQKQEVNLFEVAREVISESKLVTVKPNDSTFEACDLLLRRQFNDDLTNKKIIVIGTGNLASKIATRLSERQADVYILGRSIEKEKRSVEALNLFLPKNTSSIQTFNNFPLDVKADVVVSFLSGVFSNEDSLYPVIDNCTFIVDGGINNFSSEFINKALASDIKITRLDTRIALPYQMLSQFKYVHNFFDDVFGKAIIENIPIVSGGFIGAEGTIIVDNINQPKQVLGIADGAGGVKKNEHLIEKDKNNIQRIQEFISANH